MRVGALGAFKLETCAEAWLMLEGVERPLSALEREEGPPTSAMRRAQRRSSPLAVQRREIQPWG